MNPVCLFDFNVLYKLENFPEVYDKWYVGTLLHTLVYTPNRFDPILRAVCDWDLRVATNPRYSGSNKHNDVNKACAMTIKPRDVLGYYGCDAWWIVLDDESVIQIPNCVDVHTFKLYILKNNPPLNYLFLITYVEALKNPSKYGCQSKSNTNTIQCTKRKRN